MCWILTCEKKQDETPRRFHQVHPPQASHLLMEPAASLQAFVLENAALLEKPTHSSTVGCSPPWGAASLPTTKKAYKHRHTGRPDKQGSQRGRRGEKEPGERKPWEESQTDGIWTSSSGFHYMSLSSLRFNKQSCFSCWGDLSSKNVQILCPNLPGCLVENLFVFLRNN